MAESHQEKTALTKLVPSALKVEIDGEDIRVPMTLDENSILNAILFAQNRSLIQKQIKIWKDREDVMTPKDLKDLTASIAALAEGSAAIYKVPLAVNRPGVPTAEQQAETTALDITKLVRATPANDDQGVQASPSTDSGGQPGSSS